jgi:hypothetical protein
MENGGNWHEIKAIPIGFVVCALLGGYFMSGANSALAIHTASANNFMLISMVSFVVAGAFYLTWVAMIYGDARYLRSKSIWEGNPTLYCLTLLVPPVGIYYMLQRRSVNERMAKKRAARAKSRPRS